MGAHPKIPLEALYLETKSIPIRFIVASRRILYLHTILQKNPSEMIPQIYEAQKEKPEPGDFVNLVKNDFELIGLKMSEQEIKQTNKQKFKKTVKNKVSEAAFNFLKCRQATHSKMKNLSYKKFEMSQYLSSPLFNRSSRNLLLALRTRTVRGIKSDFPGIYRDKICPVGCGENDTIQNILTCKVLQQHHSSHGLTINKVIYEDIFSEDVHKQKQVTELFENLLEIRNNILSSLPVTLTGPLQSIPTLQNHSVLST